MNTITINTMKYKLLTVFALFSFIIVVNTLSIFANSTSYIINIYHDSTTNSVLTIQCDNLREVSDIIYNSNYKKYHVLFNNSPIGDDTNTVFTIKGMKDTTNSYIAKNVYIEPVNANSNIVLNNLNINVEYGSKLNMNGFTCSNCVFKAIYGKVIVNGNNGYNQGSDLVVSNCVMVSTILHCGRTGSSKLDSGTSLSLYDNQLEACTIYVYSGSVNEMPKDPPYLYCKDTLFYNTLINGPRPCKVLFDNCRYIKDTVNRLLTTNHSIFSIASDTLYNNCNFNGLDMRSPFNIIVNNESVLSNCILRANRDTSLIAVTNSLIVNTTLLS